MKMSTENKPTFCKIYIENDRFVFCLSHFKIAEKKIVYRCLKNKLKCQPIKKFYNIFLLGQNICMHGGTGRGRGCKGIENHKKWNFRTTDTYAIIRNEEKIKTNLKEVIIILTDFYHRYARKEAEMKCCKRSGDSQYYYFFPKWTKLFLLLFIFTCAFIFEWKSIV